jgi:ADP-ribosylglycohydrolase
MKGAIIGDIIGSAFINEDLSGTDFQLFRPTSEFTDDTVLTLATADALLSNKDYKASILEWVRRFPDAGYRKDFLKWVENDGNDIYISEGDGAARRVSPIGYASNTLEDALNEAKKTTVITHNVPIRIEASQATVAGVFMLKNGATRKDIKSYIAVHFGYDLSLDISHWKKEIQSGRPLATPVPPALAAFLSASDFEEAIRLAIYIGGPTNTIASIAGAFAEAYFKHIPKAFIKRALARLTPDMEALINNFENQYTTEDAQMI